ncbi:MAG: ImmA/IrrE family metallo-endopeptidase [Melioribacteraceae bacterium]|nr:ImmA/IrrE family metallo-endopeptidase [Melioribacteraceae bacterium]
MSITAKANARLMIRKYGFESPAEINLEELIYAENLFLKGEEFEGCEGKIIFNDTIGIITINSSIKEAGQRNFVMAHELGHFLCDSRSKEFNEGTITIKCKFEDLNGINKAKREENANSFAGELLMPEEWFKNFVNKKGISKTLISETADYFKVSLSAAALNYSRIGHRECAVVLSKDGIIQWSSIHNEFKYQFIRAKEGVSKLSYTYDFFAGMPLPSSEEEIPAEAWFNECYNINKQDRIFELNIPMQRYNAVLSLIWMR